VTENISYSIDRSSIHITPIADLRVSNLVLPRGLMNMSASCGDVGMYSTLMDPSFTVFSNKEVLNFFVLGL
jgi:hypothetical protein